MNTRKGLVDEASAGLLLRGETNIRRKTHRTIKDSTPQTTPAYLTRWKYTTRQQQALSTMPIGLNSLPFKTKKQLSKSWIAHLGPITKLLNLEKETTLIPTIADRPKLLSTLVHNCKEYSAALWEELGHSLISALTAHSGNKNQQFGSPLLKSYAIKPPFIKLHLKGKSVQLMVHLLQEIKCTVI